MPTAISAQRYQGKVPGQYKEPNRPKAKDGGRLDDGKCENIGWTGADKQSCGSGRAGGAKRRAHAKVVTHNELSQARTCVKNKTQGGSTPRRRRS
eukprot:8435719-Heterocapsa_arctica.AAC.1